MPPYLGESAQTAESFYSSLDFSWVTDPSDLEKVLGYVQSHRLGNPSAKAAIDIALHDLHAKRLGIPVHQLFGLIPRMHHRLHIRLEYNPWKRCILYSPKIPIRLD